MLMSQGQLSNGRGDEDEGSGDREADGSAEESWDDGHLPWAPGWPEGGWEIWPRKVLTKLIWADDKNKFWQFALFQTRENQELTTICDELISKVGS